MKRIKVGTHSYVSLGNATHNGTTVEYYMKLGGNTQVYKMTGDKMQCLAQTRKKLPAPVREQLAANRSREVAEQRINDAFRSVDASFDMWELVMAAQYPAPAEAHLWLILVQIAAEEDNSGVTGVKFATYTFDRNVSGTTGGNYFKTKSEAVESLLGSLRARYTAYIL